ncbi:MAG: hypothetical protein C5B59_05530 [Bacteroidetes bacterium]|nr:MAG: hypothetical protein C5B59_05530 [Bacteroidota bacterium]
MNTILSREEVKLSETRRAPAVSIIIPFEPKMSLRHELEHRLRLVMCKVEKLLMSSYPSDQAMPVINKIRRGIKNLNYNTHKKSIAIFASPLIDKLYYLDVAVEEKIVINESFDIRGLVQNKKETVQYLILILSAKSSRTYLVNGTKFILIKCNIPNKSDEYERDMPQRITHFSDTSKHKEIVMDNFLHHMDEGLSLILKAYPLPVFVMGTKKVLGHFKKMTLNEKSIVGCVQGNYDKCSENELREAINPLVSDWKLVKQRNLLQQIEKARSENKLAEGMQQVWNAALRKNGSLLIVEKHFRYPPQNDFETNRIYSGNNINNPFYIKDAVDSVMEKVLGAGGNVEFVEDGSLAKIGKIALIRFY